MNSGVEKTVSPTKLAGTGFAPHDADVDSDFGKATLRKVSRRLMPFLVTAFILNFIDRVNIGFAALQMNADLGFSATVFGYGAGILFVSYFAFGVPSNLMLHRVGARRWISSLLAVWGLIAAGMAFIQGEKSFYVMRFLLGATEAGFYPGVLVFLSCWFPKQRLGGIYALFVFASPVSAMIGSILSGYLLEMHGFMGLPGWKWMFLLEGVPASIMGVIGLFYLTDSPAKAAWLNAAQKGWLQNIMESQAREAMLVSRPAGREGFLAAVTDPRVALLAVIYFCFTSAGYGVNTWLPQVVDALGSNLKTSSIGIISAIPFVAASAGMLIIGRSSDRFKERKWHLTVCALVAGLALYFSAKTMYSLPLTILLVTVSSIGTYAAMPLFWTIPPTFLAGSTRAAGIAAINAVGNLSGLVTPIVIGRIKDATDRFEGALLYLGAVSLLGCVLVYIATSRARSNLV